MKTKIQSRAGREAGYSALFITMILVAATVLMLGATLSRTSSGTKLNDRNNAFLQSDGAAEAAVEKALAYIMVDFQNSGEGQVLSNLTFYATNSIPKSSENSYWTNYTWSDGQGNQNKIYVARTSVGTNAPYVALEEQYAGLSAYAPTYRILANVTVTNTTYGYAFTNAAQYDVQLAQIPVFQFAIFYNGLLEFSDTATLNVRGPVHANSNMYVGSPSALTFYSIVTTTGNISSPPNMGYGTNSWTGRVTYNGTPNPGYLNGQTSLNLPIGTNSMSGTNVQQILYPPPAGELYNSAMGTQRYYNKAHMVLMISNTTFTAIFKSAPGDANPATFTAPISMLTSNAWLTNQSIANSASWGTNAGYTTNWGYNWNWLTTTNIFKDWRQGQTMKVTQIDVGKMTNWMATWLSATYNTNVNSKFATQNPFNIVYVYDWRDTNSTTNVCVRLYNGVNLPGNGLTVATPNPMYIQGYYNCPVVANLGTTNTTASAPASVCADAITILSPNWSDGHPAPSATGSWVELGITASSDTVNTAMIAGICPSTGTGNGTGANSGGAMNFPRLLENWGSATLTLNTSIVCLFSSTWATGGFQLPGNYYDAPGTRNFSFDQNYTISSKMPPGTPNICKVIRAAWCNPQPGTVTYAPSPTLDFVPQ